MSRVLMSALVVSVFGIGSAHAGSLNINPFPMDKAGTLSSQGPAVMEQDSLREFADKVEGSLIDDRQQQARYNNSIDMTPMPNEFSSLSARDVYEPQVATIKPYRPQRIDLNNARIEVLPYDASKDPKRQSFLTAIEGESVEDVLRSWSEAQGVGFLWKSSLRIAVINAVASDEGFEKSVEALLAQYADQPRPFVGRLDTDPVTGVRVLSVATR